MIYWFAVDLSCRLHRHVCELGTSADIFLERRNEVFPNLDGPPPLVVGQVLAPCIS